MAELVVASGKPCAEWRGLFSVGRVEPLEEEGSMLSAPPRTPSPRRTPQPPTTEFAASFAAVADLRDYLVGFSEKMLGEISQVRRSVGGLEVRMSCLEASRRSASSDWSDGARGGKIVADPPSPGPDPDRAGSESRRARTIHPAPPCCRPLP